jgi:hypothetical protein
MKKIHISYANQRYAKSLKSLEKSSLEVGKVDKYIPYTREWLETTEFYKKNKYILDKPRGGGYWIWKPYIILETLESCEDGDVVLYSDAGVTVINNLQSLYDLASEHGKIIFQNAGHINKLWTKRDCYVLMNCDEEKYWNGLQVTATFSLWQKKPETIEFLKEYQRYLRDPRIVTDDPNMCGRANFLEFKDHRHDQSVLSIMVIKHNIKLFRDPSQWGNALKDQFTNSPYEQLFDHHRTNK